MLTRLVYNENDPFIVTFPTRTRFYFMVPTADMVHLSDIVHSLSLQPRFLGYTKRHYSVLEHSYQVALEVFRQTDSAEAALCGAFHDGEEAYTGDMPGPIKNLLPDLQRIAAPIKLAVLRKFKLDECYDHWKPIVKDIDDRMLHTESIQLNHRATWEDTSRTLRLVAIKPHREEIAIDFLQTALENCKSNKKAHKALVEQNLRNALFHLKSGGDCFHVQDYFTHQINGWLRATDRL